MEHIEKIKVDPDYEINEYERMQIQTKELKGKKVYYKTISLQIIYFR